MDKKDLMKEVTAKMAEQGEEISVKTVTMVTDSLIETIKDVLTNDDEISFKNFAKFYTSVQDARVMTNIQTGEKYEVPEKTAPRVKFSRKFKEELN